MEMIPTLTFDNDYPKEFHSVVTIQFGELIHEKIVDWSDPSWQWDYYNKEQYDRVCKKIEDHYWTREISMLPIGNWKRRFLNLLNENMPKYKKMYAALDAEFNILQNSDEYFKSRDIYSDFPQTQLQGNEDYANTGVDKEYERIYEGSPVDKLSDYIEKYRDVDLMIVNDLEIMFSSLITVNLNGF